MTESSKPNNPTDPRVALRGVFEALALGTDSGPSLDDPLRRDFMISESRSSSVRGLATVVLGRERLVAALRPHNSVYWLRSPAAVTDVFASAPPVVVIDEPWLVGGPWGRYVTASGRPAGALRDVLDAASDARSLVCIWSPDVGEGAVHLTVDSGHYVYLPNVSHRPERPRRWALPKVVRVLQGLTLEDPWKGVC